MHLRIITLFPFAASGLLLLSALASPAVAADKEFGETVRRNIELQTVDMTPTYKGTLMEGGIGRRGGAAVSRYMRDQIRPLTQLDGRTEVGSQGGSVSTSNASPAGGN